MEEPASPGLRLRALAAGPVVCNVRTSAGVELQLDGNGTAS